jgi:hypothetical protein
MYVRGENGGVGGVSSGSISRRRLLATSGVLAGGSLAGCLNRVASTVTNTGSSPAAVFAGAGWNDDDTDAEFQMAPGSPHVARLTPTTVLATSGSHVPTPPTGSTRWTL